MKLKAITIDFWNTLFDSTGGAGRNELRYRALLAEIEAAGPAVAPELFDEAVRASWGYFNNIWIGEQKTPSTSATIAYLWDYLKLPHSLEAIERVADVFSRSIIDHPPALLPGAGEALETLSSRYNLALISDTGFSPGEVLTELLEKEGILRFFSALSFSDETGVSKPNPLAYSSALEKMACSPAEALHIGDIEQTDIVGAKSLGMMAIKFTGDPNAFVENPEKTKADFTANTWEEVVEIINRLDKR
ncbi:MAG: HAD family hydrolase [Chloroflexota bacterium]